MGKVERRPPADATAQQNNASEAGTPSEGALIGEGCALSVERPVNIPASPSLVWTEGGALTWSAWIKAATTPAERSDL